jgi:O-antigen ligase
LVDSFNRVFDKFLLWFSQSVTGKVLMAVGRFFKRLFMGSLIVNAFSSERYLAAYQNSFIKKIVGEWAKLFNKFKKGVLQKMAQQSVILKLINYCLEKVNLTVLLVLLLLFGSVSYFTGKYVIVAAYIAVVYGVALFKRPEIGIITVAALAPFLPTMAAAGILAVTVAAFFIQLLFGTRYSLKTDTTGFFLIVYVVFLVIFGINSYAPSSSINIALLWSLFVVSYFLVKSLITDERLLKWILFAFCTSALFTAFYGLLQYASGVLDTTWVDKTLFEEIGLRVYSTFGNPNVYGEYLLLAIPVTFAMIFLTKRVIFKIYYLLSTVVLLAALALTYSRGCYLALVLAFIIFLCFVSRRLLAVGCVAALFVPFLLPDTVINRFLSIGNLADTSTDYRIKIWQGTIKMLQDFWYVGIGHGTDAFNSVYPFYSLNSIVAPHSHNLYLQLTVEMGIAGLILFLAAMFSFYNFSIVTIKGQSDIKSKIFIAAGIAAISGFLFQGIFDYVFYNYRVFLVFFMMLGMLNAYNSIVLKNKGGG